MEQNTNLKMETRIVRHGNGFAFVLPKAFIRTKVLNPEKKYVLQINEVMVFSLALSAATFITDLVSSGIYAPKVWCFDNSALNSLGECGAS